MIVSEDTDNSKELKFSFGFSKLLISKLNTMIRNLIIYSLIILLLNSCLDKKQIEYKSINKPQRSEEQLKNDILILGNQDAFDELLYSYMDSGNKEDLLTFAIIMSNKYKYERATFEVFKIFCELDDKNFNRNIYSLEHLDEKTRKFALSYLISASQTNFEAKYLYGNYLIEGKYVEKDLRKGKKLLDEVKRYNSVR